MSQQPVKNNTYPLHIRPAFGILNDPIFEHMAPLAQASLETLLPESYLLELKSGVNADKIQSELYQLGRQIPILKQSIFSNERGGGIILKILCQSAFMDGVGRYIKDVFSRWLVPGKRLNCAGGISLNFYFECHPDQEYYFQEELFQFRHPGDALIALRHSSRLIEEVRINILAVYHARYLGSLKSIPKEERRRLLQEHIHTLFKSPNPETNPNAFDRMHQFLLKLTEEEKLVLVNKNIDYLMTTRPQNFDRDIFYEMSGFTSHFREHFTTLRDPKHVSRIVAFHYLFKKKLLEAIKAEPQERHLSIKIVKAQLTGSDPVIGILIGLNLLRESERFERKQLLSAVQSCLPHLTAVANSFIVDRREDGVRIFYLEVHKPHHLPFSLEEIRLLKHDLPELLKRRVENVVHPIFMPRNEEEVLRNIVLLSKQIKFLRDVPHLTIHYEKQSDAEISFLIVLVRLLKEKELPFKELIKNVSLRIAIDEIRSAGSLKKRVPKEAVIFRAIVDKAPFFRKDFSLDLKKARQKVAEELRKFLGEFRDYNGGMIHKQDEALELLRKAVGPSAAYDEVLLENFFHSLRPGIMQTVHPPELLKHFFKLLHEVIDEDLMQKGFTLKVSEERKYFLVVIGAAAPNFKEELQTAVSKLKIASYDLTSTFLHIHECATLGYILRTEDMERRSQFQQVLLDTMLKWKINFSCEVQRGS